MFREQKKSLPENSLLNRRKFDFAVKICRNYKTWTNSFTEQPPTEQCA